MFFFLHLQATMLNEKTKKCNQWKNVVLIKCLNNLAFPRLILPLTPSGCSSISLFSNFCNLKKEVKMRFYFTFNECNSWLPISKFYDSLLLCFGMECVKEIFVVATNNPVAHRRASLQQLVGGHWWKPINGGHLCGNGVPVLLEWCGNGYRSSWMLR